MVHRRPEAEGTVRGQLRVDKSLSTVVYLLYSPKLVLVVTSIYTYGSFHCKQGMLQSSLYCSL